jgi:tetratricopeptide (TPR) repeat protein
VLAGIANGFASYLWENEGDLDGALKAARRMLEPFENQQPPTPWMRVLAHSRISELCMQVDQGDEARRHLKAALGIQEELGERSDALGTRWGLVLSSLQLGAIDEAEHWLDLAVLNQVDDAGGTFAYELSVRAEILLARGEVDAGLRLWRRVVDRLNSPESATYHIEPSGLDPWTLGVQAATVVAHAHHGRLDLVQQLTGELPHKLSAILTSPIGTRLPSVFELPICGALLLALGMVDLDRGQRSGDAQATGSGVRMVALAERFRFPRTFQPTMSAARARHAAEHADRSAYAEAVSTYADLGREELRAAAQTVLAARARLTPGRACGVARVRGRG